MTRDELDDITIWSLSWECPREARSTVSWLVNEMKRLRDGIMECECDGGCRAWSLIHPKPATSAEPCQMVMKGAEVRTLAGSPGPWVAPAKKCDSTGRLI